MSSEFPRPQQPVSNLHMAISRFVDGEDMDHEEDQIRSNFRTELECQSLLASVEKELRYDTPEASRVRLIRSFERLNLRMALEDNRTPPTGVIRHDPTSEKATTYGTDARRKGPRSWYWPVMTLVGAVALIAVWMSVPVQQKISRSTSRVYTTTKGQRANVLLPDGTHAVLGVASTLRYVENTATNTRDIDLNGEAYFEVMHNPAHPLVVRTNGAVTQVLGTSFSVRGYQDDAETRVVVATGRVSVNQTVLNAGEVGRVEGGDVAVTRGVPVEFAFAWTTGTIVFDDVPLSEALVELGRWYDADFRVEDPALLTRRVSGKFTRSTVADIADAIATAVGGRYERSGKHITFRTGGKRAF